MFIAMYLGTALSRTNDHNTSPSSHECLKPGVTQALMKRFASSHQIQCIEDNGQRGATRLPAWFSQLSHLDQLLAVWEWRSGPTPWLWMRALTVD